MTADAFSPGMLAVTLASLVLLALSGRKVWASKYALPMLAAVSLLWYLALPPFSPLSVRKIHLHDSAHYYLGGKYLPELHYDRLYACVVLADVQDRVYPEHFQRGRAVRDLRNNTLVSGDQLAHQGFQGCRQRFSEDRWQSFLHDVRFFRNWIGIENWPRLVHDHGFNATPIWAVSGHLLAEAVSLNQFNLITLTLIDYGLMAAAVGALIWAFGLPAAALAVLVMTTAVVAAPNWTRGSLLRWDWILSLTLCWCLVRRQQLPLLAGFFGALAAGLRVFPLLIFIPWAVHLVITGSRRKEAVSVYSRQFWTAFLSGGVLLLAVSALMFDPSVWIAFLSNIAKHQGNNAINNVGWHMLAPLFPDDYAGVVVRALQVGICALITWRLLRSPGEPDWVWLGLGAVALPFFVPGLANYYFMFLLLVATLASRWWFVAPALLAGNVLMVLARWFPGKGGTLAPDHVDAIVIALMFLLVLWRSDVSAGNESRGNSSHVEEPLAAQSNENV